MSKLLDEAFERLNAIEEELMDYDPSLDYDDYKVEFGDELAKLDVIDPDQDDEEVVEETDYTGKVILDCDTCHSLIYKDPEEVIINDELQTVNVDEECPMCHNVGGYTIVGQVCEYNPETTEEKVTEKSDTEEEVEEGEEAESTEEVEAIDDQIDEDLEVTDEEEVEEKEDLTESYDALRKEVEECLKDQGYPTETENAKGYIDSVVNYIEMVRKNDDPLYTVGEWFVDTERNYPEDLRQLKDGETVEFKECKNLKEDFKRVEIETDEQKMIMDTEGEKVTVETEPVHETEEAVIEPVSQETKEVIKKENTEEVIEEPEVEETTEESEEEVIEEPEEEKENEVDIDSFDEESFDEVTESFLKEQFENVTGYKTSNSVLTKNGILVEGVISFDSGNDRKTRFLFVPKDIRGKAVKSCRFLGENAHFNKGHQTMLISGKVKDKKYVVESLSYRLMNEGKMIKGRTKRSK